MEEENGRWCMRPREREQKGGEKVTKKVENEVKEELFGI